MERARKGRRVRSARLAWGCIGWVGILALGVACATTPKRPRISPVVDPPTQLVSIGKFVWVDLVTQDVAGAKHFYGELFGWTFDGANDGYVRVLQDGTVIAGIIDVQRPEGWARESGWLGNLSVADVDRAAQIVTVRGGVVERGPLDAPDRGRLALVRDPAGAHVLLVRSTSGDPPDQVAPLLRFLWRELWTQDTKSGSDFYSAIVGYQVDDLDIEGSSYRVLRTEGVARAGVVEAPEAVDPQWLPYVRVADPALIAKRAKALGARIVFENEDAVVMIDPTGAPIGIQAWSEQDAAGLK